MSGAEPTPRIERGDRLAEFVSRGFMTQHVVSRLPEYRGENEFPSLSGLSAIVHDGDPSETTIEYQVGGITKAFGRLYSDGLAQPAYELLGTLWKTGLDPARRYRVAEPIGLLAEQNLLLTRCPAGENLLPLLDGDSGKALRGVREAARWLAKLHGSQALPGAPGDLWSLYYQLADRLSGVLASHPQELKVIRTMVDQLEDVALQVGAQEAVQVHGQFVPAKVYLDENMVTVVDLDGGLSSDPARDVAEFVRALRRTSGNTASTAPPDRLVRAFLDEYARENPVALDSLSFYLGVRILLSMCEEGSSNRDVNSAWGSVLDAHRREYEGVVLGNGSRPLTAPKPLNEHELATRASQVIEPDFIRRFVDPFAQGEPLADSPASECNASIIRDIGSGRVTVRYEFQGKARIFGKVYSEETKGRFGFDILQRLWNGGFGGGSRFQVSEPLAYVPEYGILLVRAIDGIPFEDAIRDRAPELVDDSRSAARWLASLHRSSIRVGEPDPPWFSMRLFPVLRRLMKAAVFAPDERKDLMKAVGALCVRAQRSYRRVPPVQTHGRFHQEHIYFAGDKVAVIDLDTSTPSDPSKDLAEFLSCFRSFIFKRTGSVSLAEEPTKAFLDEYVTLLPGHADNLAVHWAADIMGSLFKRLRKQRAKHKYDPDDFERLMGFFKSELDGVLEGDLLSPYVSPQLG